MPLVKVPIRKHQDTNISSFVPSLLPTWMGSTQGVLLRNRDGMVVCTTSQEYGKLCFGSCLFFFLICPIEIAFWIAMHVARAIHSQD